MADKAEYKSSAGFVQFPVTEREANGETVRDATIKALGSEGTLIRVTLWPAFADADVQQGDFIAVDGKLNVRVVEGTTYVNLDATKLNWKGHDFGTGTDERTVTGRKSEVKAF